MAAQGDPPAVARHRLRRALRRFRDATPMSQGDVARKLSWSLSKVQRIEAGDVGVSPTDLRAMLDVYGVTDEGDIERLTAEAKASRRQRYTTPPEHREYLTPGLRDLLQYEREAVAIRAYQPTAFPGLLQTPAVAESILDFFEEALSEDVRRVRLAVRMARRAQVLDRSGGPEYYLVLDESVVNKPFGEPSTTAEQLENVTQISNLPHFHLRLVPQQVSGFLPAFGSFQLLGMENRDDDNLLYREGYLEDEIIQDPAHIRMHRRHFDKLWEGALGEDASLSVVAAQAAAFRAQASRESSV